jgi:hypothetical protein
MQFSGHCTVEIEYRRQGGEWQFYREFIDGRLQEMNPQLFARILTIDLPRACARKTNDSLKKAQRKNESVPQKHLALLSGALETVGFVGFSAHTVYSGAMGENGEICAISMRVVRKASLPQRHLG